MLFSHTLGTYKETILIYSLWFKKVLLPSGLLQLNNVWELWECRLFKGMWREFISFVKFVRVFVVSEAALA